MGEETKKPKVAGKKFTAMFMLEVKANSSQETVIRFLIDQLAKTITTVYQTARIGIVKMDREE